jgi:hypothetical protein
LPARPLPFTFTREHPLLTDGAQAVIIRALEFIDETHNKDNAFTGRIRDGLESRTMGRPFAPTEFLHELDVGVLPKLR